MPRAQDREIPRNVPWRPSPTEPSPVDEERFVRAVTAALSPVRTRPTRPAKILAILSILLFLFSLLLFVFHRLGR